MAFAKLKTGAMIFAVCLCASAAGGLIDQPDVQAQAKKRPMLKPPPQLAQGKPEPSIEKPKNLGGDLLPEAALVRLGGDQWRHGNLIRNSVLSPDGKTLATAGENTVVLWDAISGKIVRRLPNPGSVSNAKSSLVFAPDGTRLAFFQRIRHGCVWDVESGKEIGRIERSNNDSEQFAGWCCFINQSGKNLVYTSFDAMRTFDVDAKKVTASVSVRDVTEFSPDGKFFFRLGGAIGDVASGKDVARLDVQTNPLDPIRTGLAVAPDGQSFAVVHPRREIQHRKLFGGDIIASFPLPKAAEEWIGVNNFAGRWEYVLNFSGDGRILFLGTAQGAIFRWDLATGRPPDC